MAAPKATGANFNVSRVNTATHAVVAEIDSVTPIKQKQEYAEFL